MANEQKDTPVYLALSGFIKQHLWDVEIRVTLVDIRGTTK